MRVRGPALALLLALAAPPAPPCPAAEPSAALKSGDRVVFYGDSITEQRLYTRYVQQYVYVRHPDWDVRFFNAGWGGDTATGGLARLERDVLWLKPTLVTLFFGMNDGGYKAPDAPTTKQFTDSLAGIVAALKAKGVRVIVFTPGCVDPDRQKNLAEARYLDTLEGLARAALDVARTSGVPGADVFHPMLACQTALKRQDPQFTMIPDGVHPSPAGHLVVAKVMLEALGLEPFPALGRIDLETGRSETLSLTKKSDADVLLQTKAPAAVPFWIAEGSTDVARVCGLLDDLAGQRLLVTGIASGGWELSIDGAPAGRYAAADLARGVAVPGTWSDEGRDVHDLIVRRENAYYETWRNVRVPLASRPGIERVVAGLLDADEGWHQMIRMRPVPDRHPVLALTRAPAGDNLALKKAVVVSEPNAYGWSDTALTDGSWAAEAGHCFATGGADRFPKWVTIDLEKPVRVATVRLGVPPFGSTRTVVVSESIDGKKYRDVGTVEFRLRHAERRTVSFEPKTARYVRLTYVDRYDDVVEYPCGFAFTTEVEVYGPAAK